jgi:hypothetical protein
MFEPDEPYLDGSIRGHIPIPEWLVRAIWDVGKIGKESPESGWHRIGEFQEFKLEVRGYKLRGGFFSSSKWFGAFGFWFGDTSGQHLSKTSAQIDNIGFIKTRTIPDIFLVADKLLRAEWPLEKDPDKALRSSV